MTLDLHERTPSAAGAPRTVGPAASLRRTLGGAVVIGAFLSFVRAFGGGALPLAPRTAFMIAIAAIASLASFLGFQVVRRNRWAAARWWRLGVIVAALITPPVTVAISGGLQLVMTPPPPFWAVMINDLPGAFVTSLFFCLWAAFGWSRQAAVDAGAPAAATASRFLDRLPPKLRGAELWAIEAEDHYLRLHTSKGQDLILLRLSDALAELDGLEGAQTHRSWWVAREAIAGIERADGRATLTLKNGAQAPVSRPHARALRARGWL